MFRIIFMIVWVILFGLLLQRDYFVRTLDIREAQVLKKGREESFQGIYFKNERIGYVKNRLVKGEDDSVTLFQDAFLRLNIIDQSYPVQMSIQASLTEDSLLKDFTLHLSSPFYKMTAQGVVHDHEVRFTMNTGKEEISDTILLNRPPVLSTNMRGYLLKQGLKKDEKFKVPYFDPVSLSGKNSLMEYRGLKKILIRGRIFRLHHFIETFSGIRISFYLDEHGKVIKEESPAGFVFMSEPEFQATDIAETGPEILSSVSVPLTGDMPDLDGLGSIDYRLAMPAETEFELNKDRQTFNNNILSVKMEPLPTAYGTPCIGQEKELESTAYIQSKAGPISDLSNSITGDSENAMDKVRLLAEWVYSNIEKRPVLSIPDALTTLHTKVGDCNEHAALFAALARSASIPARIAAGVTFHEGAFFYHAWNEVCLDGKWISLDTTKNQIPADITHIKFVEGETREQVKIGALLGRLKIEVVKQGVQLEQ